MKTGKNVPVMRFIDICSANLGFIQDLLRIYSRFIKDLLCFTRKCPAYENW